MNRAIILHGMPSKEEYYDITLADSQSNSHWLPWLQQQLCQRDILAQTPEMPFPFAPDYQSWKNQFELLKPDNNTLLVGHSCGGGFIIRWLSENPDIDIAKVVLVAPWLDIEKQAGSLFDFSINKNIYNQVNLGIDVLYSTNDHIELKTSLKFIQENINNIKFHEFINYGHFTLSSMKTCKFPELLNICLGK